MKTFTTKRPTKDVIRRARAQGITVDTSRYDRGDDFIRLSSPGAYVLFNAASGWFFGVTPEGVSFTSDNDTHENEQWFKDLLSFFYSD